MPSAKGKPTDPKLKEKVTEGMCHLPIIPPIATAPHKFIRMSIDTIHRDKTTTQQRRQWKRQNGSMEGTSPTPLPQIPIEITELIRKPQAAKIGKEYEARGGDYENEPGSKNKPEKGPPKKKSEATKKAETSASKSASNNKSKPKPKAEDVDDDEEEEKEEKGDEKPKANEGRKARGRPKGEGSAGAKAKERKEPRQGERSSARQKGDKAEEPAAGGKKRKSAGGEKSAAKKKQK
jgi:hypothetical protein